MGFLDKLKGEFIDVIDWQQPTDRGILAYHFPRHNNEIKMGAKLTVREGQAAVFLNEGQMADVFGPGMYELQTENMPILSTLKGWKHGFQSPFKSDVYFINVAQQPDYKWGTANPIMMRDQDFGVVRIRAFGSYVFKVGDPGKFLKELVASDPLFEDYEIDTQLRQVIVSKFSDVIGESKIPVLDLCANYEELGQFVFERLQPDFNSWGIELMKFYVENISLPPAVEEAMDKRSQMGVIGNLAQYQQFQTAEAIRDAAQNPGSGGAGMGMGLGAGMAMAQQMVGAMGQGMAPQQGAPAAPPPIPQAAAFHVALNGQQQGPFDMNTLQGMINGGQLTKETLVWKQGMAQWTAAGQVPEISGLFGAAPPPIPGQ